MVCRYFGSLKCERATLNKKGFIRKDWSLVALESEGKTNLEPNSQIISSSAATSFVPNRNIRSNSNSSWESGVANYAGSTCAWKINSCHLSQARVKKILVKTYFNSVALQALQMTIFTCWKRRTPSRSMNNIHNISISTWHSLRE